MKAKGERKKKKKGKRTKGLKGTYLVQVILWPFRVVDGRLVAVVAEMAGSDKSITP